MENFDTTSMSHEELQKEYLNIKSNLEDYKQMLYETKRQLLTYKATENDLTLEIEALQKHNNETNLYSKKILLLEDENVDLKRRMTEMMEQNEQELKEKDRKLHEINDKFKASNKNKEDDKKQNIEQYMDKICELKIHAESLTNLLSEHEHKNEELLCQNLNLEKRTEELSKHLEETRECMQSIKEELNSKNEHVYNLQDELMIVQMELNKYKNLPQEKALKGNSLFAEVDDSRQQLKKYVSSMNQKYSFMKANYNKKVRQIEELRKVYGELRNAIEEKCNFKDDQVEVMYTYKKHIEQLNVNIKALKKELALRKEATENILTGNQKCTEAIIEITRNDVLSLRNELSVQQSAYMASEQNVYELNVELKKWRGEALSLRAKVEILNQKIYDLENKSPLFLTSEELEESKIQETTTFCYQRTLTVIDNDILQEKAIDNSQPANLLSELNSQNLTSTVGTGYNLINSCYNYGCSYENTGDASWDTSNQTAISSLEEITSIPSNTQVLKDNTNVIENIGVATKTANQDSKCEKQKTLRFSENTVDPKGTAKRKGRILVPKVSVYIPSIITKK